VLEGSLRENDFLSSERIINAPRGRADSVPPVAKKYSQSRFYSRPAEFAEWNRLMSPQRADYPRLPARRERFGPIVFHFRTIRSDAVDRTAGSGMSFFFFVFAGGAWYLRNRSAAIRAQKPTAT